MPELLPPKTPPRRSFRGTSLAPSPFVTPSKTPARRGRRTLTKLTPQSLRRTGIKAMNTPYFTPRECSATPSTEDDRFVPSRRNMNIELVRRSLLTGEKRSRGETSEESSQVPNTETPIQKEYKRRMLSTLCNVPLESLGENAEPRGLLSFGGRPSRVPLKQTNPFEHDILRRMKVGDLDENPAAHMDLAGKVCRKVPGAPVRILDAPDIVDDYYLNLISWSKDNILAVALAQSVYLWNASTGDIQHLMSVEEDNNHVTSVCWCTEPGQTKYIAVGTHRAEIFLMDGATLQCVRKFRGSHRQRVSSLAWNQFWMTSGSRDSAIVNHDLRSSRGVVHRYEGHTQEVCGLKWNDEGTTLASGGNENYLCLWDASMSGTTRRHDGLSRGNGPRMILKQHKAAVKALAWCPFHRGLLASGGGTADKTIKFWNSSSGSLLNSIDTGSQICSLLWSKEQRELCSSHGYSENQLILWKYSSMTKIKELKGHTSRVLNMDVSPDGTQVVSAAADETLRFWNIFGGKEARQEKDLGMFLGQCIR